MRAFCMEMATWLAITPSISRLSLGKAPARWAATVKVPMTSSFTSSGSTSSDSKPLMRIGCENTGTSRSRHSPPAGSASLFFTTIEAIDAGSLWRGAERVLGRLAHDAADGVAAAARVVDGDRGEVEVAHAARAGEGGVVDLVQGERAVQRGGGAVEALVLVLGALDGVEDALGLHDAHHLRGGAGHERLGRASKPRPPARSATRMPRARGPSTTGTPRNAPTSPGPP